MDYKKIYTDAFNNKKYSAGHHIQYDWVIEKLKKKFSTKDNFSIIDIGSGRGHLLKLIHNNFPNATITSVDLDNFHKLEFIDNFIPCNITSSHDRNNLLKHKYDVLVNLDFLEHIEEQYINEILKTFHDLSKYCIIAVANHSDVQNGVELHLIQQNNSWWELKLKNYFSIQYFKKYYGGRLYFYELNSK